MGEIVNPYIAGAPVTEQRMFFGREDIFQWIENSIAGQYADHILVIHGQRRVGKTSVLKQLGNRLPKRYIPVFFDLQGRTHTTLDRFLWWLAREIVRVLKQERGIEIPIPEKDDFTKDLEYFENRFLPDLQPALAGGTLLLTFDEFDNLEESEAKEELARPLVDHLRRMMGNAGLNFIFSIGSSGRKLENMQAAYTEFFKTALYKKISFLSEEQTRGLVTRPVEGVLEYERAAVERIYGIASGHPYFTQLTCHELFARCQRTEQRRIAKSDVEAVLDDVVERGTVNLKFVWDEAADIEKWSLAALAQLDKPDPRAVADYLRKNRVRFSETDLTSGLLHLREKDVLTSENRFVIHLLKLWLQKNRPIEQAREELTEVNPIANRYIEIGLEFKDSHLYEKAIESFQEALAIAKDNIQAQVNIALVYMDQKVYDKAVVEFEKALAMDDEEVSARAGLCEAHLALGDAAMTRGRPKEAALSYQRVLAINAEHTEARQRMAELSRQRAEKALTDGKDEEALSAFGEALKYTPEDPALIERVDSVRAEKKAKVLAALLARSEKEAGAKNWEGAIKSLEEALPLAPNDASIQKKISEIKAAQEKARLETLLAKAETATRSARWDEAIETLTIILSSKPDETVETKLAEVRAKQREARLSEFRTQARSMARAERFDEALSAWGEYLALEPPDHEKAQAEIGGIKNAQALAKSYAEAQRAFAKKNYDQAVSLLKGIINQDENYKDASRLMAQAIELRRTARKWWQSRWVLGGVVGMVVLIVGWLTFRYGAPLLTALQTTPTSETSLTGIPVSTVPPTILAATAPPTATAAPLPYSWARLNSGQFLSRDLITTILIDPTDPGVMYAGTNNAGIYKSIDGGISWQPIHNGFGGAEISTLIMDPNDPKTLYAGVNLGGVYKTTNGGQTWLAMNTGIDIRSEWLAIVEIDRQDSQHLYFTESSGLYETKDGGETWHTTSDTRCIVGLAVNPLDGNVLYTARGCPEQGEGGIYKSTDGGKTWTIAGFESQQPDFFGLWIEPSEGKTLFVSVEGELWISHDEGKTWAKTDAGNCHNLVFDRKDPSMVYCATSDNRIMKTTDAGTKWSLLAEPNIGGLNTLTVSPQDSDTLFLGTWGLYLSTDGGKTWKEQGSGLSGRRIELKFDPQNASILYAEDTDCALYRSTDGGHNWETVITNQGCGLAFDTGGTAMYRVARTGELFTSFDNGLTWSKKILPFDLREYWHVAAHPFESGVLYISGGGQAPPYIYYSEDAGQAWQAAEGMVLTEVCGVTLFFDHNQGNTVYGMDCGGGAFSSTDGGRHWTDLYDTEGKWMHAISDSRLLVDPRDGNHLVQATRGAGVLSSSDGGRNWTPVNQGIGSLFVHTLAQDSNSPDTVYAGTDGGAYISFNGGGSWNPINDGLLGATVVYSIVVDKDGNVYAATPYGIFKLESK